MFFGIVLVSFLSLAWGFVPTRKNFFALSRGRVQLRMTTLSSVPETFDFLSTIQDIVDKRTKASIDNHDGAIVRMFNQVLESNRALSDRVLENNRALKDRVLESNQALSDRIKIFTDSVLDRKKNSLKTLTDQIREILSPALHTVFNICKTLFFWAWFDRFRIYLLDVYDHLHKKFP